MSTRIALARDVPPGGDRAGPSSFLWTIRAVPASGSPTGPDTPSGRAGRGARGGRGLQIEIGRPPGRRRTRTLDDEDAEVTAARAASAAGDVARQEFVLAIYMARPIANAVPKKARLREHRDGDRRTRPPQLLFEQLFPSGVPASGAGRRRSSSASRSRSSSSISSALAIAFVLVGTIARNVNRLTRAAGRSPRGDFSVRVNSQSRDQIGDLARSFDGMAESIERLLVETAARSGSRRRSPSPGRSSRSSCPPPRPRSPGSRVLAHFAAGRRDRRRLLRLPRDARRPARRRRSGTSRDTASRRGSSWRWPRPASRP